MFLGKILSELVLDLKKKKTVSFPHKCGGVTLYHLLICSTGPNLVALPFMSEKSMTQIHSMFYNVYVLCICISHVLEQAEESPVHSNQFNMKSVDTSFMFINAYFSHIVNDFWKEKNVYFLTEKLSTFALPKKWLSDSDYIIKTLINP